MSQALQHCQYDTAQHWYTQTTTMTHTTVRLTKAEKAQE